MSSEEFAGVALAGGESKRMGRNKAILSWPPGVPDGKPLWQHALDRLRRIAGEVVLADGGRNLAAESVTDGPGRGPVAGILGAADKLPDRTLLVLAVDLPLVVVEFLSYLVDMAATEPDSDWIVPSRPRGLEPLCAVYRPSALAVLRRRVSAGAFDLYGLADASSGVRMSLVDEEAVGRFGDPERLFLNVNCPEDLRRAERGE